MKRAVVAAFGWPANLQDDAVYPYTEVDGRARTSTGANKYTLTFPKGAAPPVDGFWSITMYMIDGGWWFVPNPLNKFTVSLRNNPTFNPDGSTTLYFQVEFARDGQGSQLAAGAKGDVHADAENVLAQGEFAFDPQRIVEAARGAKSELVGTCQSGN